MPPLQKVSFSLRRSSSFCSYIQCSCWMFNGTCISKENDWNFLMEALQIELLLSIALAEVTAALFECCSKSCRVAYYSASSRVENWLATQAEKSCFAYSILLMRISKRAR
jgi:hypothetical protein